MPAPTEQVACARESRAERGGAPSPVVAGMKEARVAVVQGCRGMSVGLHVLPEQVPALRGGVCAELERWLSGSSSPEPIRHHRAMLAVLPG